MISPLLGTVFLPGKIPTHHTDHMKPFNAFAAVAVLATSMVATAAPASAQFYSGTQTAIAGSRYQTSSGPGGIYTGTSLRISGAGYYNYTTPRGSYSGTTTRIGGTTSYNFQGY